MDHDDLAAVRPAYRLLRDKLADLDRARARLQGLIDGFEDLYPALAQEGDAEAPEAVNELPTVNELPAVDELPTVDEQVAPVKTPTATDDLSPKPLPLRAVIPSANDYIPRGKEAVVAVMAEEPGRWFYPPDVLMAMIQRGWTPRSETSDHALRAVRTALFRAVRAGRIEGKEVDGRTMVYRYRPSEEPSEVTPSVT